MGDWNIPLTWANLIDMNVLPRDSGFNEYKAPLGSTQENEEYKYLGPGSKSAPSFAGDYSFEKHLLACY